MEYTEDMITWVLPEDYSMIDLLRITLLPKATRLDTLDRLAVSKTETLGN
jgi:hypothetical protein